MTTGALAALAVVGVWWLSTGVVLKLVWLPRATHRFSIAALGLVALGGLYGLWRSSRLESAGAAYLAFGCALAVWAWHELTFLLGAVTGPRRLPCPPGAAGWRRFAHATATLIYHEVALASTLLAVAALTAGGPNRVGFDTFFVLWIMRLSAKFNVFLGVRNFADGFVPEHLRYLLSYVRRARFNALMPASLLVATAAAVRLGGEALAEAATPFVVVSRALVTTLLILAIVEHIFLAARVPDAILWRWAIATPPPKRLGGARAGAG